MTKKAYILIFCTLFIVAIFLSFLTLSFINYKLSTFPIKEKVRLNSGKNTKEPEKEGNLKDLILQKNLFKAKLNVELPKPKTEKEIEAELLEAIVKEMSLKGVMLGQNTDSYAVIDRGAKKGVWAYSKGEVIEKNLAVYEIKPNEVMLKKDEFAYTLKLFAKGYEKRQVPAKVDKIDSEKKGQTKVTVPATAIKKEGARIVVDKKFAESVKNDKNFLNSIASTVAVKANLDSKGSPNGIKVVSVDRGSLPEKIGILPNDIIQEINGYKLTSNEDVGKAYETLKNSNRFEVKILRKGAPKTLYFEIK